MNELFQFQKTNFGLKPLANLFLVFFLGCLGCSQEQPKNLVIVTGDITHLPESTIEIYKHIYPSGGIEILGSKIFNQSFSFSIELNSPIQAFIKLRDDEFEIYLEPGDSLHIKTDGRAPFEMMKFSGIGESINNYLVNKKLTIQKYEARYEQIGITFDEFVTYENELYNQLTQNLSESISTTNRFYQVEMAGLIAEKLNNRHYFIMTNPNLKTSDPDKFWSEIPFNHGLDLININYRNAIENFQSQKIITLISDPGNYLTGYHGTFLQISKFESNGITDYLLAYNLINRIDYYGITNLQEDYLTFRENFPDSPYLEKIEAKYDAWDRIFKGSEAPEISFETVDGSEVLLSDFIGKTVYIDIWASWCKPCLEEIPYRKQLTDAFENKVIFLNVSVDETNANWLKALAKYPEFTGVHVIGNAGWSSDIMKQFLIQEIPKYIIIDPYGKIETLSAPPPSSVDELATLLDKYHLDI